MYEAFCFIIIFIMHINSTLSKKILAWYDNSKRELPWRVGKKSPKKVYYRLLSEFMLQQTQVKTVIPFFYRFTKKFKTLKDLSKSNEKVVFEWSGNSRLDIPTHTPDWAPGPWGQGPGPLALGIVLVCLA